MLRSAPLGKRRAGQESLDVGGELRVMLKEETMGRARVNLHPGLGDQTCEQVRVMRQDHGVAVAVRNEHRHLDGA